MKTRITGKRPIAVNTVKCIIQSLLLIQAVLSCAAEAKTPVKKTPTDLNLAHKGTVEIDTALLNKAPQPESVKAFFEVARRTFGENPKARFVDMEPIRQAARQQGLTHLGGPMLGALTTDGLSVWVRTIDPSDVTVQVTTPEGVRTFGPVAGTAENDLTAIVRVTGLKPETTYPYRVLIDGKPITMPKDAVIKTVAESKPVKIAFGADFHKFGLWNRNLLDQIRTRGNAAMLLLGDSAVDDRNADVGMHRSDYLLRDLSPGWQDLVASVPVYATWDDHDYFDNDLSGIPKKFTDADRKAVRKVWTESWNNPSYGQNNQGIYFRTRIGPCDIIMLDTRYCRTTPRQPDCYLGKEQTDWLYQQLKACTGPFIILTSGTMWSDYISAGKDSWGIWDPPARQRLFDFIEQHKIGGVLLLSGDRHGGRVLRIRHDSGFVFHEFELGSLGAHGGPGAMGEDVTAQLQPFGITRTFAFGELTFDTSVPDPTVTMQVIDDQGKELYQETLTRSH